MLQVKDTSENVKTVIQDVQVGETFRPGVNTASNLVANAPFSRASIRFQTNSFNRDTVISVTPIKYEDIEIRNKPDVNPIGPILALRPSPYQFPVGAEPTLTFHYTVEEVRKEELNQNNVNIYQIDNNGDIVKLDSTVSFYKVKSDGSSLDNSEDAVLTYEEFIVAPFAVMIVSAKVPHFSNFVVLKGPVMPRAPTINTLPALVRVPEIDVSGKAAQGYEVVAYIDDDPLFADPSDSTPPVLRNVSYTIPGIQATNFQSYTLPSVSLNEGTNYIFVTYANTSNRAAGFAKVVRDSSGPLFSKLDVVNPYFSPNGDGIKDYFKIDFDVTENCVLKFEVKDKRGNTVLEESKPVEPAGWNLVTWKGLNSMNQALPEGLYTWRARLYDLMGNNEPAADRHGSTRIDLTGVSVTADPEDIGAWSPNNDSIREDAEISYTVNEDSDVTIEVINSRGDVIRTNLKAVPKVKGSHMDIWNGMDERVLAPDGNYLIKIKASDVAGNLGQPAYVRMSKDTRYPSIAEAQVSPKAFDPRGGSTKVGYFLSEDAEVTTSVLDTQGIEIYKIMTTSVSFAGPNSFDFNGLLESGAPLAPGMYTLKLTAQDPAGNISTPTYADFIIVRDRTPPVIVMNSIDNSSFSPKKNEGEGTDLYLNVKDTSTLSFTFEDEKESGFIATGDLIDVSVGIYQTGRLIRTLYGPDRLSQGTHLMTWDGRDQEGALVQNGEYYFKISGKDKNLNQAVEKLAYVNIDHEAPSTISFRPVTRYLSLTTGTPISFSLNVKDNMSSSLRNVKLNIFAPSGGLCATVGANNQPVQTSSIPLTQRFDGKVGSTVFNWNGRDTFGNILPDGIYKVICESMDEAGNASVSAPEWAVIDTVAPVGTVTAAGRVNKVEDSVSELNNQISPNPPSGDGVYDLFKVALECKDNISDKMNISMEIYASNGPLVSRVVGSVKLVLQQGVSSNILQEGNVSNRYRNSAELVWDGKNTNFLTVEDGRYYYKLIFSDRAGNSFVIDNPNQDIRVDNTHPAEVSFYTVSPSIISPTMNTNLITPFNKANVQYTVPESDLTLTTKVIGQADRYDYLAQAKGVTYPEDSVSLRLRVPSRTMAFAGQPLGNFGISSNSFQAAKKVGKYFTVAIHMSNNGKIIETNRYRTFKKNEAYDPVRKIRWIADRDNGVVWKGTGDGKYTNYPAVDIRGLSFDNNSGRVWYCNNSSKIYFITNNITKYWTVLNTIDLIESGCDGKVWVLGNNHQVLSKYSYLQKLPSYSITRAKITSFKVNKSNDDCFWIDGENKDVYKIDNNFNIIVINSNLSHPFYVEIDTNNTLWVWDNIPMPEHDDFSDTTNILISGLQSKVVKLSNFTFNNSNASPDRLIGAKVDFVSENEFIHTSFVITNSDDGGYETALVNPTHILLSNTRTSSYVSETIVKHTNSLIISASGSGERRNIFNDTDFQLPFNTVVTNWDIKLVHSSSTDTYIECRVTNINPNGDFDVYTDGVFAIAEIQHPTNLDINTVVQKTWNGHNKYGVIPPDNTYTVRVYETDPTGNVTINNRNIEIDTLSPTLAILSPMANSLCSNVITFRALVHDKNFQSASLEYKAINDISWILLSAEIGDTGGSASDIFSWDSTGLNGESLFRLTAMDRAGNISSVSLQCELKNPSDWLIKTQSVTNQIFSPNSDGIKDFAKVNLFANQSLTVKDSSITKEGISIGSFLTSETFYEIGSIPLIWNGDGSSGDGVYDWSVTAERTEGGIVKSESRKGTFVIDTTLPSVVLNYPSELQLVNGLVGIRGQVKDDHFSEWSLRIVDDASGVTLVSNRGVLSVTNGVLGTFDSEGLNGTFTAELIASDLAGNTRKISTHFIVDNKKPIAILEWPLPGTIVAGPVMIRGTVSDVSIRKYSIDVGMGTPGMNWVTVASGFTSVNSGNLGLWNTDGFSGLYTVRLTAYDRAGNVSVDFRTMSVDNLPPLITLTSPSTGTVVPAMFNISASVNDNNFSSWSIQIKPTDAAEWMSRTNLPPSQMLDYDLDLSDLLDGNYDLSVKGRDLTGNAAMASISIILDKTRPNVSMDFISTPGKDAWGRQIIGADSRVQISVDDANPSTLSLYLDKSYTGLLLGTVVVSPEGLLELDVALDADSWDGEHQLVALATDKAGNQNEWTVTIVPDLEAPVVTFLVPASGSMQSGTILFKAEIDEDNFAGLELFVDETSILATADKPASSYLLDWSSKDSLYASDERLISSVLSVSDILGNKSSATLSFNLDNLAPRIIMAGSVRGSLVSPVIPLQFNQSVLESYPASQSLFALSVLSGKTNFLLPETEIVSNLTGVSTLLGQFDVSAWDDGEYQLVYVVSDRVGHKSTNRTYVRTDKTPAQLVVSTPVPSLFCPLSGIYDHASIQIDSTENAKGELIVSNSVSMSTFTLPMLLTQGENAVSWNGRDTLGEAATPGVYSLLFRVWDDASNMSQSNPVEITIVHDINPPQISLVGTPVSTFSPDANGISDIFSLNYSIQDDDPNISVKISVLENSLNQQMKENFVSASGTYPFTWNGNLLGNVKEGSYQIVIVAEDSAHNQSILTQNVILDLSAPTLNSMTLLPISYSPNGDGLVDQSTLRFIPEIDASYPLVYQVLVDTLIVSQGVISQPSEIVLPFESQPEGIYPISVQLSDSVGNGRLISVGNLVSDMTPPEVDVFFNDFTDFVVITNNLIQQIWTRVEGLPLSLEAYDPEPAQSGIASFEWKVNEGTWNPAQNGSFVLSDYIALVNGESYTVTLKASDNASNKQTNSLTLHMDNGLPQVILNRTEEFAQDHYLSADCFFSFQASDEETGIRAVFYSISNKSTSSSNSEVRFIIYSEPFNVVSNGDIIIRYYAMDLVGNVSAISQFEFSTPVPDIIPPVISVSGVSDQGMYAYPVTPVVSATDENGVTLVVYLNGVPYLEGTVISNDGSYLLQISAEDPSSNSSISNLTFTVDRTYPTISIHGVENSISVNANIILNISVSDTHLQSSSVLLDQFAYTNGKMISQEGSHQLVVSAVDLAGNTTIATLAFVIDKTKANILISGVVDGEMYPSSVTPIISVSDSGPVEISALLDGNIFISGSEVSSDGAHSLEVTVTDQAGNVSQSNITFTIDQMAPLVTITGVDDGVSYGTSVSITVDIEELHPATNLILLNGVEYESGNDISPNGSYMLSVHAVDSVGHITDKSVSFIIDRDSPIIQISGVMNGDFYKNTVKPVVSIADANLKSSSLSLDGIPFISGNEINTEGEHILVVRAEDTAGNIALDSVSFVIDTIFPSVTITGVEANASYAEVRPIVNIFDLNLDNASTFVLLDGTPFLSGNLVQSNGNHLLVVHAQDLARNVTERSVPFEIRRNTLSNSLLFYADYDHSGNAVFSKGDGAVVDGGDITSYGLGRLEGESLNAFDIGASYNAASNVNPVQGTVMMWINPFWLKERPQGRYLFSLKEGKDNSPNNYVFNLAVFDDKGTVLQIKDKNNNYYEYLVGDGPQTNWKNMIREGVISDWQHYAFSWNSTTGVVKLYMDGALKICKTNAGWLPNKMSVFWVGNRHKDQSRNADARIDDFRIYDREVDSRELKHVAGIPEISSLTNHIGRMNVGFAERVSRCYADAWSVIYALPEILRGGLFLKTSRNAGTLATNALQISFNADEKVRVYIAVPQGVAVPNWVKSGYSLVKDSGGNKITITSFDLSLGVEKFDVYVSDVEKADAVLLKGLEYTSSPHKNYFVIIKREE